MVAVAEVLDQVLDDPMGMIAGEQIGGTAVLPGGVAEGGGGVGLEGWLGEEAGEVTGEHVA